MLLTMVLLPLWFILLIQVPAVGWLFVGLGLVCAAGLLLAGVSASVHGVVHEAGAMWQPVFGWLPPGLRDNLYVRLALGGLAFVLLNVMAHWLLR